MTALIEIPHTHPTVRLGTEKSWADFSPDKVYRFALGRAWDVAPGTERRTLVWCLLNPSVANAEKPDPTLTRCMGFSRAWGYSQLVIINPYAFVTSDPKELPREDGVPSAWAIGPGNDEAIRHWSTGRDVVVGWGVGLHSDRAYFMGRALANAARLDCMGTNNDGSPKHPLYLPTITKRQPWTP